jgi:hypothetical protein
MALPIELVQDTNGTFYIYFVLKIWFIRSSLFAQGEIIVPSHKPTTFRLRSFSLFHKAHSFGVIREEEETLVHVRQKVFEATDWFRRASTGPLDIGSRYAKRLEMIWGQDLRLYVPYKTPATL